MQYQYAWSARYIDSPVLREECLGEEGGYERTGRPLETERFIEWLERILGRVLHRQKPGPKLSRNTRR